LILFLSACQVSNKAPSGAKDTIPTDGFAKDSYEEISRQLQESIDHEMSLNQESAWLNLRLQVVEAEKFATQCRSSELKLAAEMSRFGSLDKRLPKGGFIKEEERIRWNAQLDVKKSARITAEARANLLRRDLKDLTEKLLKDGYQAPAGSVFE